MIQKKRAQAEIDEDRSSCRAGLLMETSEPGLTVGMPVCNAMPWLPEAMDSLLQQTMKAFQILAIVDGGMDDSAAWLRNLENRMARTGFRGRACGFWSRNMWG